MSQENGKIIETKYSKVKTNTNTSQLQNLKEFKIFHKKVSCKRKKVEEKSIM